MDVVTNETRTLHVAEGELDGLTLRQMGATVIAIPGGNAVPGGPSADWLQRVAQVETLVLWMDQDEGGSIAAERFVGAVSDASTDRPRIFSVSHDYGPLDVNDLWCAGFCSMLESGIERFR
ncbi:toprim domain-containing protein [Gemmatimonadota bacterium]